MLYEHTSAKLFGVILRLLRNRTDAEDALQDVYVKIWHQADKYAVSDASVMSWLITVARNHAIDRLRQGKSQRQQDSLEETGDITDDRVNPEMSAVAGSERRRIDECFERLDAQKSKAVREAYLEGYSYKELADKNKVPLNTMRTWLRRSLMKLKECLEE